MNRARVFAVVAIAVACSAAGTLYVVRASRRAEAMDRREAGTTTDAAKMETILQQAHAVFRTTRLGEGYGHLVVTNPEPSGPRYQTALECERVAVSVSGGICLTADRGVITTYQAVTFDAAFQARHRLELSGIPSRVRLSPDGRLAGITVFVSGHAYSDTSFSTRTTIVETESGTVVTDLEQLAVSRDGRPFKKVDFNFWGVTFAHDSRTFYATLGSNKQTYLVRADVATKRGAVLREGVECPSLSPDNRQIAFKKRVNEGGRQMWRLAILDLASGAEHLVAGETRSVDDQVEWLDNSRIAYALSDDEPGRGGTSVWAVDIAGGAATLWADGAYSPAIVRPAP